MLPKPFGMSLRNYSIRYSYLFAGGSGNAGIRFANPSQRSVTLRRMSVAIWYIQAGAPPQPGVYLDGVVQLRAVPGGTFELGPAMDLTVLAGTTLIQNGGRPFCTPRVAWEGCFEIRFAELYDFFSLAFADGIVTPAETVNVQVETVFEL